MPTQSMQNIGSIGRHNHKQGRLSRGPASTADTLEAKPQAHARHHAPAAAAIADLTRGRRESGGSSIGRAAANSAACCGPAHRSTAPDRSDRAQLRRIAASSTCASTGAVKDKEVAESAYALRGCARRTPETVRLLKRRREIVRCCHDTCAVFRVVSVDHALTFVRCFMLRV